MKKTNRIFFNAMMANVFFECVGIFADKPVIAECSVVALLTTGVLWEIFLYEERKTLKKENKKRVVRRRAGVK